MKKVVQFVKDNKWIQMILLFIVGAAVGALFYPSKTIIKEVKIEDTEKIQRLTQELTDTKKVYEEKLEKSERARKTVEKTTTAKISSLRSEITNLEKRVKTSYYRLVKPDGTIEERRFTESEVTESTKIVTSIRKEFDEKIKSIEDRWVNIHRERVTKIEVAHVKQITEYKEKIHKLESREEIRINEKTTGIEAGFLSNKNYYIHVHRDLFGPVFIGVHGQTGLGILGDPDFAVGGGVGFRW